MTVTETAESFFKTLEQACTHDVDTFERYRMVRGVFYRCVEQTVHQSRLNFSGMFAKVDYIIKDSEMPYTIARLVNLSRRELFPDHNARKNKAAKLTARMLPHHVKATALLVMYAMHETSLPESLKAHFPKADRKNSWGGFDEKRLRVIVCRWDEENIWATEEEQGTELRICYGKENEYLSRGGKGDWSYLSAILTEGTQLNLVRLRMKDDVCYPELIIYEPDYLINITTVASCFETYAESPYVNLVNKIKPQANSIPIHLGNLAGEFLDDCVHQRDITFDDAFRRFIMRNAVSMISCKELSDGAAFAQFRDDAVKQRRNIEKLIGEDLPAVVKEYRREDVVLEPSFFCELLGIQGRMDFLFEDKDGNSIIIEQKSGKGAFPPNMDPEVPEPQEKHIVQLLLYRALFRYSFDKFSDDLKHIMLLYSKYAKGLISVQAMPETLLRAIRMRNLLAWCEMKYATDGFSLLNTLTPEMLNRKGLKGKLWDAFVRVQLQDLLWPISTATPLEKAYYQRFLRFIAVEQMLAKLGNKTKENSGFASVWNDTLDDKQQSGNILLVHEAECIEHHGMPDTVKAKLISNDNADGVGGTNFRTGDIVILYPYMEGHEPDACAQMVHRATIVDLTPEVVTLRLRNPSPEGIERSLTAAKKGRGEVRMAIEHDLFESSSGGLYSAMHSFLSAPKERRDLLLFQRKPRVDETIEIKGEYGSFNTLVRHAKQARDLFLVIGPPGTGKTSFGLVNILNEELLEEGTNILLVSYTNRAVDEICSKLEEQGTDYIRIGAELSCSEEYRPHLLMRRASQCASGNEVARMVRETRVFCATTSSLNANISLLGIKHFSLAIVDESSQILEPHLIGLFSARHGEGVAIDRFVLIGDHKQLPAVVQQTQEESAVEEEILHEIHLTNCRYSLFERLLKVGVKDGVMDPQMVYMLTKQGRMHRDIAEFPNIEFYGGKLDIVPLSHQKPVEGDEYRVKFFPSPMPKHSVSDKTNEEEARMIAEKVVEIYHKTKESFDPLQTIGVIVPYRNQITMVRNAIDAYGIEVLHDITIDTVERYQGSQRDYILYGFTIHKRYQLNFLANDTFEEDGMLIDRKLNVAMTRARLYLYIYGNPDILSENVTFRRLMEFILVHYELCTE